MDNYNSINVFETNKIINKWWADNRMKYNKGLILAGVLAFFCYAMLGSLLINDFEITLFSIFFQGIGYLFMMAIANVFYFLGPFADKNFNKDNNEYFRKNLFYFGYWFSFSLPFIIPALIVIIYLVNHPKALIVE